MLHGVGAVQPHFQVLSSKTGGGESLGAMLGAVSEVIARQFYTYLLSAPVLLL